METPDHGVRARLGGCSLHRPPRRQGCSRGDGAEGAVRQLDPRVVFGGGDARRRLARKASRWTRVVWGLVLASLAASLWRRLRARCLSSSLAPPQDRENCHVGGNVFVSFDGSAPVTLCNLYRHLSNKVPFLLYGEDYRGYRGVQRVTTLEYV